MGVPISRAGGIIVVLIACAELGCLTTKVVREATHPHPSFISPGTVTAAATARGDLYLQFEAGRKESDASRIPIAVRITIADLETDSTFLPAPDEPPMTGVPKLPVHVVKSGAIPSDASPVPVRQIHIATLGDLEELLSTVSQAPEVWVVDPAPGAELEAWGHQQKDLPSSGPMVALILPSDTGRAAVGLYSNYYQLPHGRRAMWLVTPFSAVGDLVLLPGYLVYMLCGAN